MAKLTVLGIGNTLMTDEAIGVRLMEAVRDCHGWPEDVEFVDGGAGGLGLMNVIEDADRLVVFDAAEMKLPAGEFRIVQPNQVSDEPLEHRASMHDMPFMETLELCERFGRCPQSIQMFVVQPASIELGRGLSKEVSSALGGLAEEAEKLVSESLGEITGGH